MGMCYITWEYNMRTKNGNDHSIWQWQESVHNHGYIIRLVIVHFSPSSTSICFKETHQHLRRFFLHKLMKKSSLPSRRVPLPRRLRDTPRYERRTKNAKRLELQSCEPWRWCRFRQLFALDLPKRWGGIHHEGHHPPKNDGFMIGYPINDGLMIG